MSNPKINSHWVADLNEITDQDLAALEISIRSEGQQRPIVTLPDGRIIDGRSRALVCERIGVEPLTEQWDPVAHLHATGNTEPTDEDIERAIVDMARALDDTNRDKTASARAYKAAIAWKRLYPNGAPNTGQFSNSDGKFKNELAAQTFPDFAKGYKVSASYAKMALSIVNNAPDLIDSAKNISEAYGILQDRKKKAQDDQRQLDYVKQWRTAPESRDGRILDVSADLIEQYEDGSITLDQAVAAATRRRDAKAQDDAQFKSELESIKNRFASLSKITELPKYEITGFITEYSGEIPDLIAIARHTADLLEQHHQKHQ